MTAHIPHPGDTFVGWFILFGVAAYLGFWTVGRAHENLQRRNEEHDRETAADFGEPTRVAVETWSETPLYDATAAYIAGWEAQAIDDEWAALQREIGEAS